MTRRRFSVSTAAGALAGAAAPAAAGKPAIVELRKYWLRNSLEGQPQRLSDFLEKAFLPVAQKVGFGPVGFFASLIAPDSPFYLVLLSYPSLAAMEEVRERLEAHPEYARAVDAFRAKPGLSYQRMENSLLRAFPAMPQVEVPLARKEGPRVFELRIYESNNPATLKKKIGMFENGEIAIFRKTGLLPVFFGETIVGTRQPNLTYLLAFDDLASRERNWRAFIQDPEWVKLRATPGLSDAEVVSNISNVMLRPLPFSPIR